MLQTFSMRVVRLRSVPCDMFLFLKVGIGSSSCDIKSTIPCVIQSTNPDSSTPLFMATTSVSTTFPNNTIFNFQISNIHLELYVCLQ